MRGCSQFPFGIQIVLAKICFTLIVLNDAQSEAPSLTRDSFSVTDPFVFSLVTWPLNGKEAEDDLC